MADLYEEAQKFRDQLLTGDRRTAAVMVRSYSTAYQAIDREIDRIRLRIYDLREKGVEKERFASLLYQEKRVQALQDKTLAEISRFAQRSDIIVGGAVGEAVIAGSTDAKRLMQTTLPEGISVAPATIDGEPVSAFSPEEVGLRTGALEQLTGVIQPGQPVASIFQSLGPEASKSATDALISGLALGKNPNEIAAMMRQALGGNLTRALTIARTETLRAYREASRAEYLANDDVVDGWIWVSAASGRTCASCWAQHGSEHPLDEVMATHPRCRCSMAPKTKTWQELGFGRTPESVNIPSGSSLFAKLSPEDQRSILGPGKFAAYRGKKIALSDLVARRQSPVWGPSTSEAGLAEALRNAEARKASRPVRQPRPRPVEVEQVGEATFTDRIREIVGQRKEWGVSAARMERVPSIREDAGGRALDMTRIQEEIIEQQLPQIEQVGQVVEDEVQRRLRLAAMPTEDQIDKLRSDVSIARENYSGSGIAFRQEAREQWMRAREAYEAAVNAEAIARRRIVSEVISEIRGEPSRKIKIRSTSQMAPIVRDASELLPGSWVDLMESGARGMKIRKVDRGFFREFPPTIAVSRTSSIVERPGFSTALHELGHWAEWKVPGLKALQSAWYRKRTIGEELKKLREVTGNTSYKADEVTREDKFADPYIGRDYSTGRRDHPLESNYEILTMTLEALFATDPTWRETLDADPGTARFVLGMLALL